MQAKKLRLGAEGYPSQLTTIHSKPKQLYVLGNLPQTEHWVGVVGSRKATAYGREVAYQLSYDLAKRGVIIVSGLALGIDTAAHQGAVDAGGITVAVLGGGFEHLYPASNRQLAAKIIENGALISEYEPSAPPLRQQFPARNRIVAGLSQVIIVAEAALSSGSLITASFALEEGREVMSVPGNINQPGSAGCNQLIKTGAQPLTNVNDVFEILGMSQDEKESELQFVDGTEEKLYRLIAGGTLDTDELIKKSKLEPSVVSRYLTLLELNGHISPQGAGNWMIKN